MTTERPWQYACWYELLTSRMITRSKCLIEQSVPLAKGQRLAPRRKRGLWSASSTVCGAETAGNGTGCTTLSKIWNWPESGKNKIKKQWEKHPKPTRVKKTGRGSRTRSIDARIELRAAFPDSLLDSPARVPRFALHLTIPSLAPRLVTPECSSEAKLIRLNRVGLRCSRTRQPILTFFTSPVSRSCSRYRR